MNLLILQDTDVTCLHLGEKAGSVLFPLSSSHNTLSAFLMDANLFRARLNSLFCRSCSSVYVQSCMRLSHMRKRHAMISRILQPPTARFVCSVIYCIEDILSFTNIFLQVATGSTKALTAHFLSHSPP